MKIPNSTSSSHLVISECILAPNQLQGMPQTENSGTRAFLIARGDAALPHRAACGVPATSTQLIIKHQNPLRPEPRGWTVVAEMAVSAQSGRDLGHADLAGVAPEAALITQGYAGIVTYRSDTNGSSG